MKLRLKMIATFFKFLGNQHYYEGIDKPHWYKTRLGFKTAWDLAKIIHSKT
jgi:hypothetical protein